DIENISRPERGARGKLEILKVRPGVSKRFESKFTELLCRIIGGENLPESPRKASFHAGGGEEVYVLLEAGERGSFMLPWFPFSVRRRDGDLLARLRRVRVGSEM